MLGELMGRLIMVLLLGSYNPDTGRALEELKEGIVKEFIDEEITVGRLNSGTALRVDRRRVLNGFLGV
ncbi:MAG: hypothetical protein DRN99_06975 [Thermoproteota archaeon]|nr:MAG: hypothetical protein DRN99_06975 [Candidatus Korarchaeota archaeon]